MSSRPWFAWFPADYRAKTAHLTYLQDAAYRRLLDAYYERRGPLPANPGALYRLTSAMTDEEREAVNIVANEFFTNGDGLLKNTRCDAQIEKESLLQENWSKAGKAGVKARWGERDGLTRSQRLSKARENGRHTDSEWNALRGIFNYKCVKCDTAEDTLYGGRLCKDHVLPLLRGGNDSIFNIQPICRQCNSGKGANIADYRDNACADWKKRLTSATQTPNEVPYIPDSDSDLHLNPKPRKRKNKAQAPFMLPDWIPEEQWNAWIEARVKIRKPATDYAKRVAVLKLDNLREQGHPPAQVLMQSAFNSWQGLFPPKEIK